MYYTACLLLTIQWQLLCQAIVSLVYKWEGLLKIVWGGCNPSNPPLDPPLIWSSENAYAHIYKPGESSVIQPYVSGAEYPSRSSVYSVVTS